MFVIDLPCRNCVNIANAGWKTEFSSTLALFASYVTCVLRTSPPKRFSTPDELRPVIVFSDGAWEPTADHPAGGGIVFIDPVKNKKKVAEINIDARMVAHWRKLIDCRVGAAAYRSEFTSFLTCVERQKGSLVC